MQGTLNGGFIDNLSNIRLAYDGDVFGGTLTASAWDPVNSQIDASSAARLSADASLNEFVITGSTGDYEFLFVNNDAAVGSAVFAADDLLTTNNAAFEAPIQGSWNITAAVPEPASLGLLVAGLAIVGAAARRRRAA